MVTAAGVVGRVLYGLLFVVGVPLALAAWAHHLEPVVPLPVPPAPGLGVAAAVVGLALLATGIADLMRRGLGLPMNAFPPRLFVRTGIYRWIRNPIYVGFGLAVAGVSLARESAAGLWVVTPVTVLGMLALVWGYERHDLLARFGPAALDPPLLSLPRDVDGPPTPSQRAAVYVWVLLPWLAAFYGVQALGRAPDVFTTVLPVERGWPVMQWTEAVYVLAYVIVPTAPLVALGARGLRRFAVSGLVGTIVVTLLWLVIPAVISTRPFEPSGVWGRLLAFEQASTRGVAALPAFHVLWALIAGMAAPLAVLLAVYLVLLQTNLALALRSTVFGLVALVALVLALSADGRRAAALSAPARALALAFLAWSGWSAVSLLWSADPVYSLGELKTDVLELGVGCGAMLLCVRRDLTFRRFVVTVLAAFAVLAIAAIGMRLATGTWNDKLLHHGVGTWSTHVVIVAPTIALLRAPPPAGFGREPAASACAFALVAVALASAKVSENRMVWPALIASLAVIAAAGAWRWPERWRAHPARRLAAVAALTLAMVAAFVDVATMKAESTQAPPPSIGRSVAEDPRLAIWTEVRDRIAERPWVGHGYGKEIVGASLATRLGDHNERHYGTLPRGLALDAILERANPALV